jgi:hypothetical protein
MSQFLLVLSRYYATRAAGVAATILGQLFTSDETGSLLIYKNVSSPPYYSLVTSTGSVTSVAASGGTTGLSFTGGPVTSSGTLTLSGTLAVANGGTGGATQAAARSGIGAAAAGSNSDITALTGLSTAITIAQGGTGSTTQGGARGNLGLGSAATMTGPSGAIVGDSDSQTLTNKTLTAPTLTSPVINSAQFATVTGSAPLFGIRAWGSFTCPSGSVTVNGSGNVSSVTRSSAGIYVVAFTTAMPDTNYSVTATGSRTGSASGWDNYQVYGLSTGGFTISCETTSNVGVDQALVNFQVVR